MESSFDKMPSILPRLERRERRASTPFRLLCLVLQRHKAHPRPLRRFADRLSIRHVILLPLDEGLHVSGWDQPHRMAQLAKLPRPVGRPATSLQRHKTARLPREKLEHLGPHQALAEHHPAGRSGPVRLKYPLRNIKPYRASLAHGRLPCGGYSTPLPWHINAVGGRPHHQGAGDVLKVEYRLPHKRIARWVALRWILMQARGARGIRCAHGSL